eukprot:s990_g14.t1
MHASYGTACIVFPSHCAPGRDDFDFFCFNLTGVPLWSFRLNHRLLCDWRGIHCRKHILKTTRPTRGPELTERKPVLPKDGRLWRPQCEEPGVFQSAAAAPWPSPAQQRRL